MTQSPHLPTGVGWSEGQRTPTYEEHLAEADNIMDEYLSRPRFSVFSGLARLRAAANRVLHSPATSKRAKVRAGLGLTQKMR